MPWEGFGEIAEKLRRSTVHISSGRRGHGSGVIVKPDGVIITNAHVAAAASFEVELWDGSRAKGELLARDPRRDLAVLRVAKRGLPAVTLADSDRLRVGELVSTTGWVRILQRHHIVTPPFGVAYSPLRASALRLSCHARRSDCRIRFRGPLTQSFTVPSFRLLPPCRPIGLPSRSERISTPPTSTEHI